jgi:YidC/Oxa1 family membrane protein insertase
MSDSFFSTFLIKPLYNGLIFLIDVLPGGNVAVALIIITIAVRLLLFPVAKKSIENQIKIRHFEPEVAALRAKYTNKQEQALKIMAFYKEKNLNPLSGLLLVFLQIPVIFALYYVFMRSGLPEINAAALYDFIIKPQAPDFSLFGFLDLNEKSYFLASLCAITQFFQIKLSMPVTPKTKMGTSFKDDLAKSMSIQMRYIFPVVIFFISYSLSGIIALYWTTSNLFTIFQEYLVKNRLKKEGYGN